MTSKDGWINVYRGGIGNEVFTDGEIHKTSIEAANHMRYFLERNEDREYKYIFTSKISWIEHDK